MQERKDERSLPELFGELAGEMSIMVRQEVDLAKTEVTQKARQVAKDIGFMVAGGAMAYAGFLVLLAAVAIGLGQLGLPWWLAALIVALVVLVVGGLLVQSGLKGLKQQDLKPTRTIESLREDKEWAKAQTK